ncbi:hypothetical protein [Sphingomonas sp. CFBP 13706]|uniref:hypothetical protein n=1 Tax=Sphingomonas sp. CFBP 13706 TaxID=2775314 RepID=UPI001FD0C9ED|nr:hypothetical protein [Sphingomonas sp. CFBP 13706]
MLDRLFERQQHPPDVSTARLRDLQGQRTGFPTFEHRKGLLSERCFDARLRHERLEQDLHETETDAAGLVHQFDGDDVRLRRRNLRVAYRSVPPKLEARDAAVDNSGSTHLRTRPRFPVSTAAVPLNIVIAPLCANGVVQVNRHSKMPD